MRSFAFKQPIETILTSSTQELAITLADVKAHLRIDWVEDDTYITNLIKTVSTRFEKITGRDLIIKTYKTFIDQFPTYNIPIILPRCKVQSIVSIQYYKSDVLTTVSANDYYFTESNGASEIYLKDGLSYPSEIDVKKNCITINFTSGFGANNTFVPMDIKQMLMEYIAFLYKNRGDACCNNLSIAGGYFVSQIINPFF